MITKADEQRRILRRDQEKVGDIMMPSIGKQSKRTKAALLANAPLHWQTDSVQTAWDPDLADGEMHIYEIPEISIVISGNGIHRVMNQSIPCRAGDIYITQPNVPHGFFAEAGGALEVRRLWFDPDALLSGPASDPDHMEYCCGVFSDSTLITCATLTTRAMERVLGQMDDILGELQGKQDRWQDAIASHLSLLLITVSRYVGKAIKTVPTVHNREWGLVSKTIRSIMQDHGNSELTLNTIAAELCVSPSHLSRLFRRLTGKNFSDYLRNVRLDQACRLLMETELSVEQIIFQCGLRDVPSFYRSFQARMDTTPNRYRVEVTHNQQGGILMVTLNEISEQLQKGKWKLVKELVQQALEEGASPEQILNEGLLAGMQVIGELFRNNEVYIPEVMVAARAMNVGVQVLKPHLSGIGIQAAGRVCIGTVQGDLHDIGKNLVKMMMESKGLEVVDLGTDVAPETFVKAAIEENCQVICCSALLTTTMDVMKDVVKAMEEAGIRDKVKIMIGGAPVTQAFCDKIGADVYTVDAASAANAAVELCRSK